MIAVAVAVGATTGLGVWLVAWALRPAPRPLTDVIAGLPAATVRRPASGTIAGWLLAAGATVTAADADLAITGRATGDVLVAKLRLATIAAALPFLGVAAMVAAGVGVSWPLAVPAAAVLAAVGWFAPDVEVRSTAADRRTEFGEAFAAYLDLVGILLAGGAGPETACYAAATSGNGWAFDAISGVLARARLHGRSPWDALADLAADLRVPELAAFADATGMAGREGAKVRSTLSARADAARARRLAAARTAAGRATERMTVPVVGLGIAFLLWLLYPGVVAVAGL